MNIPSITAERIALALDRIQPTHGTVWEEFANAYLAPDFPELRPVGGMHDQGRDAYLYEAVGEPGIYIQHSVQADFRRKSYKRLRIYDATVLRPSN
jgi:hypothetical protein